MKTNDLDLEQWKRYEDLLTDSLWLIEQRDTSGAHSGWYHGNFVPQIPHQLLRRFTCRGDWVLDPFVGSGTTLIECRRLGRHGIGIELNPEVARRAGQQVSAAPNPAAVHTHLAIGDARAIDIRKLLVAQGCESVQLVLLHPPYHDIIPFSTDPRDLSTAKTTAEFLEMLGVVLDRTVPLLDPGRYLVLVIGDKYAGGEWVPLGSRCMEAVLTRGLKLKSTVVKNIQETRSKRGQRSLWRYRALKHGFYTFGHEYIHLFQKPLSDARRERR